jgi:hypothetical protein
MGKTMLDCRLNASRLVKIGQEKAFLPVDFFPRKNTLYNPDPRGGPAMKAVPPGFSREEVNNFDRD